jgi:hypothetical protein
METNYTKDQKDLIKHLWILHYDDLGIPCKLKTYCQKFFLIILVLCLILSGGLYRSSNDLLFSLIPLMVYLFICALVVADGFYSSKRIYEILEMCKLYVDNSITIYDIFLIIGEDKTLKKPYHSVSK